MTYRFEDQIQELAADGFIVRRRVPSLSVFLFVVISACVLLSLAVVYNEALGSKLVTVAVVSVPVILLSVFVMWHTQSTRDLVLVTEFQNSLFANATRMHTQFCLITKVDGTIVYYDPGFQTTFPDFIRAGLRQVDLLLQMQNVAEDERAKLGQAYTERSVQKIVFNAAGKETVGKEGEPPMKLIMTVEPLARPHGFFILRGREFIEKRHESGAVIAADASGASEPLAALLHHIPLGIYTTDAEGNLLFVNHALESWLGYETGEMVYRQLGLQDIVSAEMRLNPGAMELSEFDGEVRLQRKQGILVQCHLSQKLLHARDGRVAGCQGVVTLDSPGMQTQKKTLAGEASGLPAALHASLHSAMSHFIACVPLAAAELDAQGQVLECNAAFTQLTDATPGAPQIWLQRFNEISRTQFQHLFDRLQRGETPVVGHSLEIHLTSGANLVLSVYMSRVQEGEQPRILLCVIDTTEQKNLEMRFAHSQKMQAVGQLAGGVAHDFNNLLTAMNGFCDLLLMRHPAGDPSFADIMQIKQNANRAANLVRQLLAFSRRQTLQPKMLDITDVLAELSNLVRRLIGENIQLNIVHGRDLGAVKADQGQLEQVLINLAVNARDAMSKGGTLTVRTSVVQIERGRGLSRNLVSPAEDDVIAPGEYVRIDVEDTGTGIPRHMLQKIFEPFFSTKEVGSGTGLGLSTVYGIVKQTGGYVYVSSIEGQGTIFSLFLPRFAQAEISQANAEQEAQERSQGGDLTGKGTVLLVEDETPVRIFAARALRNKGYTVLEAENGEMGLEVMEQHGHEVELIVTDVIMPGMNGPTMVEKLLETHPNLKVIFISGYAEDVFIDAYGTERSFNFLPKPFTLKQLASKVKEVREGKVG